MADLYISEYTRQAKDGVGIPTPVGQEPATASQKIAIAGSSAASAAFGASTYLVAVHTDVACHVVFAASSPVATAANMRLAADQTYYFGVTAGDALAVIVAA